MPLIPREEKFFELFSKAADNMVLMGQEFANFINNYENVEEKIKRLHNLEHEGDIFTHEIIDKLNRTFITPFDREDIQALSKKIDDVVDAIQVSADRMVTYRIDKPTAELKEFVLILTSSLEITSRAIKSLDNIKQIRRIMDYCIEINRFENEADVFSRKIIAKLFEKCEKCKDAIDLIRWKEIYEHMETALDKCEDVANLIEGILVKNA